MPTLLRYRYIRHHCRTCFKKHLLEIISFIADRPHDRGEHPQHPRDQPGQRQATRRIVST
ncbi:MAG: hypothetical protein D6716_11465, partial [Chloroflexi bacterium]